MKNYEKPDMKKVSFQSDEKIAKTCWGHHRKGTTLYADPSGEGYYSFQIAPGSCSLNLMNVRYITKNQESDATPDQVAVLANYLVRSGGNEGNPFHGEGVSVKTDSNGMGS